MFSQSTRETQFTNFISAGIYLLKVNSRNTKTRYKIGSKLTIKIPERDQCCRSGVFIVNFEHISRFVLVFSLLTLNRPIPTGVFLSLAFLLALNRYFCFGLEKSNYFYRKRLSYLFLLSLLKDRSCE